MLNPRAIATLGIGYGPFSMAVLGLRAAVRQPQTAAVDGDSRVFSTLSQQNRHIIDRRAKRRRENDELIILL